MSKNYPNIGKSRDQKTSTLAIASPFGQSTAKRRTEKYEDPTADTGVPEAQADMPIPFLLGRRRIDRPNVIALGVPVTKIVTESVTGPQDPLTAGGFFVNDQYGTPKWQKREPVKTIVSQETRVSFMLGICQGPNVKVLAIFTDQTTTAVGNGKDVIFFEEGQRLDVKTLGEVIFYPGNWEQPVDPTSVKIHVSNKIPADKVPAYRGTAYMVFEDILISDDGNLSAIAFEACRDVNPLGLTDEQNVSPEFDINIMTGIYELITNDWGGVGCPSDLVDVDSFKAAAITLADEENWASIFIQNTAQVKTVLSALMQQANGGFRWNDRLRKLQFVLYREDWLGVPGAVFNDDNIASIDNMVKATWYNLPQAYELNFPWRAQRYANTPFVMGYNRMSVNLAQRVEKDTFTFVVDPAVASMVAEVQFSYIATPVVKFDIQTNRDGFSEDAAEGKVIYVTSADHGLNLFPMRVMGVSENGEADRFDTVTLSVEQASYDFRASHYAPPAPLVEAITGEPHQVDRVDFIPVPFYAVLLRGGFDMIPSTLTIDDDVTFFYVAVRGEDYNFFTSYLGPTEDYTQVPTGEVSPVGALVNPIGLMDGLTDGIIDEIEVTDVYRLSDVNRFPARDGEGVFVCGDEYFQFKDAQVSGDGLTLYEVKRSVMDSSAVAHNAGAEIVFMSSYQNVTYYGLPTQEGPYDHLTNGKVGNRTSAVGDFQSLLDGAQNEFGARRFNLPVAPHNAMLSLAAGGNVMPRAELPSGVSAGEIWYLSFKERDRKSQVFLTRESPSQVPTEPVTYVVTIKVGAYTNVPVFTPVAPNDLQITMPADLPLGPGTIEIYATSSAGRSKFTEILPFTSI